MIKEADMIINFLIAAVLAGGTLILATVGEIITLKNREILILVWKAQCILVPLPRWLVPLLL